MELYLDSADIAEIKTAFEKLPFLSGLTTTPTFMHRHGITDIDGTIIELSRIVPILQIEALGNTATKIVAEADRQLELGLDPKKTVFKIPVSVEGVKACYQLRRKGLLVNVHLVYSVQQAYMAFEAGAAYVCPLVGRLQDQGHDALGLVEQCVDIVDRYGYDSKVMFSSVRNAEHVKNALSTGAHTFTAPWKIVRSLTENHFTTLGTNEFFEHTKLMTLKVGEVLKSTNPTITEDQTVIDSLEVMSKGGFGAVAVLTSGGSVRGVFTDGDLRRLVQAQGKESLQTKLSSLDFKAPISIEKSATLYEASQIIQKHSVDMVLVMEGDKQVGILDVQDVIKAEI